MKHRQHMRGFTIVELLIVIVVIAILAAISVVAYSGIQERARVAQASAALDDLRTAITVGREAQSKTLLQITGSGCTRCQNSQSVYERTLDRISAASGMSLDHLKSGDPWGNMYSIDENEGENGSCGMDTIGVTGSENHPGITNIGRIPLSGFSGCTI